jgi:hypothetical protein
LVGGDSVVVVAPVLSLAVPVMVRDGDVGAVDAVPSMPPDDWSGLVEPTAVVGADGSSAMLVAVTAEFGGVAAVVVLTGK